MAELAAGADFGGYRIEEAIGRGGMGVVYREQELGLGRQIALKVVAPELLGADEARLQFIREAQLAASLEHPNVMPIYAAGEHDGTADIAMRLIGGSDLQALVRHAGPLAPPRAVHIAEQIAAALDAAHAAGLVHRDVKPANVLVTAADHVHLTVSGSRRTRLRPLWRTSPGRPDNRAGGHGRGADGCPCRGLRLRLPAALRAHRRPAVNRSPARRPRPSPRAEVSRRRT